MYRGDVGARGDRLLDGALNDHVGRWLAQRIADVRRYCLEVCGGVDGENEMLDAVLHQAVERFCPTKRPLAALEGGFDRTVDDLVSVSAPGLVQCILEAISDGRGSSHSTLALTTPITRSHTVSGSPVGEAVDDRLVTGQQHPDASRTR